MEKQEAGPSNVSADDEKDGNRKVANADKRARVFDLEALVQAAKTSIQVRHSEQSAENAAERQENGELAEGSADIARPSPSEHAKQLDRGDDASVLKEKGEESDEDDMMPVLPPGFVPSSSEEQKKADNDKDVDSDDDFEGYAGEGLPVVKLIPAACEAKIEHGEKEKPVTALAVDHAGVRFLTGGLDYTVSMFDFQRMDKALKPDRQITPADNNVIQHLSFAPNGETIIVCSGASQIKLLDRRGTQFGETVRGDQYLVDLSNTKGHTACVNCSVWNPTVKGEFITCSDDGTLRIWHLDDFKDLTRQINKQRKVIKTKNANGERAMPQSCAFSSDGKHIAAGCDDGSIQMWVYGKMYVNTKFLVRKAHSAPITSIAFSPDGNRILSRGLDGALKMWSLKDNKAPLHMIGGLETDYKMSDCGWSPRGELVFTCTSCPAKNEAGSLIFLNPETFEIVYKIEYPNVSCIRAQWHPRLNQILVGLSDGTLRIYYDPETSHAGALSCVTRPIRRARQQEVMREQMILSPLSIEMFQARGEEGVDKEVTSWRLKKYLRQKDNELRPEFRKPADMPMSGPSAGGRVASSGGTLHSYVAQQLGRERNNAFLADVDVRASILRHAEAAEKDPLYINKAYRKTQPVTIFAEEPDEADEPEKKRPRPLA